MGCAALGANWEGIQCYAVLIPDLLRWKIIRRNVCVAVGMLDYLAVFVVALYLFGFSLDTKTTTGTNRRQSTNMRTLIFPFGYYGAAGSIERDAYVMTTLWYDPTRSPYSSCSLVRTSHTWGLSVFCIASMFSCFQI